MSFGDRKSGRVTFDQGVKVRIFAIDGSWQRDCALSDISDTGARLTFDADIAGLNMNEFFLALSANGLAHRRCRLVRTMGNQIGVRFVQNAPKR
jgi:PilZ domain